MITSVVLTVTGLFVAGPITSSNAFTAVQRQSSPTTILSLMPSRRLSVTDDCGIRSKPLHHNYNDRKHSIITCNKMAADDIVVDSTEYGTDMDQDQMMESDMLIVVDENDQIITGDIDVSKKVAHSFTQHAPRGILHRAFSLFVFDESSNLLLTQRASSKITFPSVWTNTACSHPLVGMPTSEVDVWPDCYPAMTGIKHAAVRKARHELGLDLSPYLDDIQFVSRYHYWASDVPTHGPNTPWGEHELDYVLMVRIPMKGDDISDQLLRPNPDEVGGLRFVSIDDLKSMLYDTDSKMTYSWSPWFVGIMERDGFDWWNDLDNTLKGDNTNTDITYFDPPAGFVASYNDKNHDRSTGVIKQPPTNSEISAAERLATNEPKEWVTVQGG